MIQNKLNLIKKEKKFLKNRNKLNNLKDKSVQNNERTFFYNMKPKLTILSDLWGAQKSEYLSSYKHHLSPIFDITFIDSCEIGNIDISNYSEENLHQQFVKGGIDIAVEKLLKNTTESSTIIGLSVGGVIAWKAALKNLPIDRLFTVSSNRLRNETEKPDCFIRDFYGENDPHIPSDEWFEKMNMNERVFNGKDHELYKDEECIEIICNFILNTSKKQIQPNNSLHGIKLKDMLEKLVDHYGWESLGEQIDIRCFNFDPSIGSSLKFLRKTNWAKNKVEKLYIKTFK